MHGWYILIIETYFDEWIGTIWVTFQVSNFIIKFKTEIYMFYTGYAIRERPFNLKGGGYGFLLKKYSDSQCCWKKYSDFGGGKKK